MQNLKHISPSLSQKALALTVRLLIHKPRLADTDASLSAFILSSFQKFDSE